MNMLGDDSVDGTAGPEEDSVEHLPDVVMRPMCTDRISAGLPVPYFVHQQLKVFQRIYEEVLYSVGFSFRYRGVQSIKDKEQTFDSF